MNIRSENGNSPPGHYQKSNFHERETSQSNFELDNCGMSPVTLPEQPAHLKFLYETRDSPSTKKDPSIYNTSTKRKIAINENRSPRPNVNKNTPGTLPFDLN